MATEERLRDWCECEQPNLYKCQTCPAVYNQEGRRLAVKDCNCMCHDFGGGPCHPNQRCACNRDGMVENLTRNPTADTMISMRTDDYGGFRVEEADESVGIFGEYWWHEDCESPHDDNIEADYGVSKTFYEGEGLERNIVLHHLVICRGCKAEYRWITREWDPDYPAEWEDG